MSLIETKKGRKTFICAKVVQIRMSFVRPRLCAGLLVVMMVLSAASMPLLACSANEDDAAGSDIIPMESTISAIKIDSDADLESQATANLWPGNGTDLDPYLINGLTLVANDSGPGLQVQNTTLHLRLQNIVMEDDCLDEYHPLISLYNASGIELWNVVAERDQTTALQVSIVRNSSVSTCILGPVEFEDSSNITLINNTIDESDGFSLSACEQIMISGNQLDSLGQFYINGCTYVTLTNNIFQTVVQGVVLINSSNITFWSNTFLNCSICVPALAMGEDLFFRTLTAPINNSVNGFPLLFVRDIDLGGGTVPAGTGQILLYNVTNATIIGQYLNGTSNAITAKSCGDITISSNTISWSLYALVIADSHQVSVIDNDLLHCFEGIQSFNSEGLLISGNDMNGSYYFDSYDYIGTGEHGILLYLSWGEVLDNTIASYYYGLRLILADGSEVIDNRLSHTYFGLRAETVIDLTVDNNTFFNGRDCIYISDSSEVLMINNTMSNAEYGCVFYYTDNCEVLSNYFYENIKHGLYIYTGSDDNLIAGNLFSDNNGAGTVFSSSTVQAQDIGLRNRWNSTTGGNEWSDWPGPDVNDDGFVDSPYPIGGSANARDYLPLASAAVRDDDSPPYLTITSPANGTWSDSMNLIVTWGSGDNETSVVKHYIDLDGDGWQDVGLATGSEVGTVDGTHIFSVMAVDLAGNSAIRNVTFMVDTTAPVLTVEPLALYYTDPEVRLNWSASDAGIGLQRVEMQANFEEWIDVTGNVTYLLTNLTDGQHNITITAYDSLGWNTSVSFDVYVDLEFDHLDILTPVAGATNAQNITLTWAANDWINPVDKVELSVDGQDWFEVTGNSYEIIGLGEGDHNLTLRAWDEAGHNATSSVNITIDRTSPIVEILTPLQDQFFNVSDVDLTWQVQDVTDVVCSWRVDGGSWNVTTSNSTAVSNLSDGQHTLYLSCRDQAGNYANVSVTIKVDATAPVVVITSPMPGEILNGTELTVTWTVTDVSQVTRSWRLDFWPWHTIIGDTVTLSALGEGNHTLYLSCRDEAGHYTNISVMFEIDTTSPTASCVFEGDVWSNFWNVTITLSEEIDPVNYTLLINGEDMGTGSVLQNSLKIAMDAPLQGTSLSVSLTCEDLAGNEALFNWTFTFYPFGLTVNGTARDAQGEPVQGVTVLLDGAEVGTTDAQGYFSFYAWPGSHQVKLMKEGFKNLTRSVDLQMEGDGLMDDLTLALNEVPEEPVTDNGLGIEVLIAIGLGAAGIIGAVLFLRSRKK